MSEEEEENDEEDKLIRKLTGESFNRYIWNTKKDIVVLMCSERDMHLCEVPKTIMAYVAKWSKEYEDI